MQAARFWATKPPNTGASSESPAATGLSITAYIGDADDAESGYRFDQHHFALGEYVSIREQDDRPRTFRVVKVMSSRESRATRAPCEGGRIDCAGLLLLYHLNMSRISKSLFPQRRGIGTGFTAKDQAQTN